MTRPINRREGEPSRTGHRLVRPARSVTSNTSETITVTLTENMGYIDSQQAAATVDADPGTAYIAAGLVEGDEITVHDPQNRFLWALDGAKGKAAKATNADTGVSEWVLVECETKANHIVVTLNENVGYTDPNVSYSATVQDYWEGQNPGSPQDVWDTNSEFAGALSGDTLHARWDEIDGKYRLISEAASAQHEIWFTANNDMAAGTSSAATVNKYIGNDPGATEDVLDPDGADGRWKDVLDGSTGHAVRHSDGKYYITFATTRAAVIKFQVNQSTVAHTDATFAVDNVSVVSPPGSPTPTVTTVNNLWGFPAVDDVWGIAFYNGTDWDGLPKPPLEQIDVPTDLRYDGHPNSRFEWKKTQNVLVWQADDEDTNWTDQSPWHSCVHEAIISNLRLDSGEAQQYEETAHVLEAFVDSAWDQWNDTTACS